MIAWIIWFPYFLGACSPYVSSLSPIRGMCKSCVGLITLVALIAGYAYRGGCFFGQGLGDEEVGVFLVDRAWALFPFPAGLLG